MVQIADKIKLDELIQKGDRFIVDFFSQTSKESQMYMAIFNDVSELENITMIKVDIDKFDNLEMEDKIKITPTTVIFDNGKEVKRKVGLMTDVELRDFIK